MSLIRVYAIIIVVNIFVFALAIAYEKSISKPVAAAPEETPACEAIAHAGALIIFRCEDMDTGTVIYANNIGMMVIEP